VTRFVIVGAGAQKSRLQSLLGDQTLRVPVRWTDDLDEDRGPVFFIRASTIFAPAVLTHLRAAWDGTAERVVPSPSEGPSAEESPGVYLAMPGGRGGRTHRCPIPTGALYLDAGALPSTEAERRLGASLANPTDNWFIRLGRRLLTPTVLRLARTPLTPTQLTMAWFALNLVGALLLARGSYWPAIVGTGLCLIGFGIDLMDGMLARLKFLESPRGAKLDLYFGFARSLIILIALTIAVARTSGEAVLLPGSLLIGGALIATPLVWYAPTGPSAGRWLAETLGHGDWILILFACALLDRLTWFFWAAAVGANIYWMSLLATRIWERRHA
jgi:phosphatidylglycerophosphate synthase